MEPNTKFEKRGMAQAGRNDSHLDRHDVTQSVARRLLARQTEAQRRPSGSHLRHVRNIAEELVKGPFLPLRRAFITSDNPQRTPPLANLQHRAGLDAVQIKTFLLVLWMAAYQEPHQALYDADVYAKTLDLPDVTPGGSGARRVRDAVRKLERLQLVESVRHGAAGPRTHVRPLKEDGSGTRYNNPAGMRFAKKPVAGEGRFIPIPHDLMRNGWFSALSGAALTTWLILRERADFDNPYETPMFVSPSQRESRYKISDDTYLKGLGELEAHGLVRRTDRKTKVGPGVFDWSRQENAQLIENALRAKPNQAILG